MKLQERYYSAEEISGGRDTSDRLYSESELTVFNDLFNQYYDEHYSFYEDNQELAYADFYDAYSTITSSKDPEDLEHETKIKEDEAENVEKTAGKKVISKNVVRAGAAGVGALAGFGATELMLKKLRKRRKEIIAKYDNGAATKAEIQELDKINKKIKIYRAAGTALGAGLGYGSAVLANKYQKK